MERMHKVLQRAFPGACSVRLGFPPQTSGSDQQHMLWLSILDEGPICLYQATQRTPTALQVADLRKMLNHVAKDTRQTPPLSYLIISNLPPATTETALATVRSVTAPCPVHTLVCAEDTHMSIDGYPAGSSLLVMALQKTLTISADLFSGTGSLTYHGPGSQTPLGLILRDQTADGLCLLDPSGHILHTCTPSSGEAQTDLQDQLGRTMATSLIHPEDCQAFQNALVEVLSNPSRPQYLTVRMPMAGYIWTRVQIELANKLQQPKIRALVTTVRKVPACSDQSIQVRSQRTGHSQGMTCIDQKKTISNTA